MVRVGLTLPQALALVQAASVAITEAYPAERCELLCKTTAQLLMGNRRLWWMLCPLRLWEAAAFAAQCPDVVAQLPTECRMVTDYMRRAAGTEPLD